MRERGNIHEKLTIPLSEGERTTRPNLLDVVKIDNRFAQVILGGDTVRYLDDNTEEPIEWDNYELVERYRGATNVDMYNRYGLGTISEEEIANIHWEARNSDARLKRLVSVFGEFRRKG